ncbi:MAG: ADP-glyceromanno-heptose 6-epimerase [Saprospiraceae bacterium]|nr:ADP-glyceromanno-heptose 6-epimerase [Saprospiraceae bacterium]
MIIVTGAAGFIGSALVRKLNDEGHKDILLVDDFSRLDKVSNLEGKTFAEKVDRDAFIDWLADRAGEVEAVFHLGARTDTTEKDTAIFDRLNLNYSKNVWRVCTEKQVPLIYASSAATYGLGELGYSDSHELPDKLQPLNPYGESKNDFDKWVLKQRETPPFWAGLKFFNVYGPNEYHKGRMASVIFHTARQIKETGKMKLFRSHREDIEHGHQKRDFVYVKDVVDVCYWLYRNQPDSGLFNVGSGEARTFLDLATNTFRAMDREPDIEFIDTPEDIRNTYQYFTEAEMDKLRAAGYEKPFHSLEEGIEDYVGHYLAEEKNW